MGGKSQLPQVCESCISPDSMLSALLVALSEARGTAKYLL